MDKQRLMFPKLPITAPETEIKPQITIGGTTYQDPQKQLQQLFTFDDADVAILDTKALGIEQIPTFSEGGSITAKAFVNSVDMHAAIRNWTDQAAAK
ncbi:Hypothetical predicted protein, partial [Paramuricea clavata]